MMRTADSAATEDTIPRLFARNATEHADLPALTDHDVTLTWSTAYDEVRTLAAGLASLGLEMGQTMLIMASNRMEHWLVDLAAVHLGAVPGSLYATASPEQVRSIAEHSRARVAVLEGPEQLRRWSTALAELPHLDHVILLQEAFQASVPPSEDPRRLSWDTLRSRGQRRRAADPTVVDRHTSTLTPDHPVTVLYTSGTTGSPKGVILSHRNVVSEGASLSALHGVFPHTSTLCHLPLAHIAERMSGMYLPIYNAMHVHFCPDPARLVEILRTVRPSNFFTVPRLWEKLAATLEQQRGEQPRDPHELRAAAGLDQLSWAASGAAPISSQVLSFLAELGVEVREVWGLTETTGAATANPAGSTRIGTVGTAVPGMAVELASDGEVLVRGPSVCRGYLQQDGSVHSAVDAQGWLHTGDLGQLSTDGYLTITGRSKELIVTSSGENVAPTTVEHALQAHPLVDQALAYGDQRPYVVALLVLDSDAALTWARTHGVDDRNLPSLAQHPDLLSALDEVVRSANARLSRPEQVKRFRVLPDPWTIANGELTPTLKVKRRVVEDKYSDVLADLYR